MRKVIRIDEQKTENKKPVEFTHHLHDDKGWVVSFVDNPGDFKKIVYLGKCLVDGDMFACYYGSGSISIFKGHLNSGEY